ncbi:MAG: site-specific integrase [Ktedonobacterales bacterium]|nr:site-specific integrase [Ktedonobacterales bacterium]
MKRRSNNQGSVIERGDGRWEVRISLPGGKRKSVYMKNGKEAEKKLRELLTDLDKGIVPADGRQTVKQYLTSWLETVQSQVEPSSYVSYRTHMRRVMKGLGHVSLAKLTAQQLQSFYAQKLADGLASTTTNTMHTVIKAALDDAVALNLVTRNVASMIKAPKYQPKERVPLTEEQARVLLNAAKGNRLEALYVLVLSTGMREGELIALEWKDIDFQSSELYISHGLQYTPTGFRVTHPKSNSSKRRIMLPVHVLAALKKHRELQEQERKLAGTNWDASYDYVFPNGIGRKMLPSDLRGRSFYQLLKKAALPAIHFHDLRHTAATLLLRRGVHVKVVSEMLGHANVGITLRIYAHVMPGMQQQAADMAGLMFGRRENEDS